MSIFEKLKAISQQSQEPAGPVEYIIAGLGNPGTKYENTRHNVGFMAVDTLAEEKSFDIKKLKFKSLCADVTIASKHCLVMKPTTFMNNSGEAVAEAARFYKIKPENIIVIFDDISLDVGNMRIRRKGSDGGHNGIKSIIMHLNSDKFPRIKLGVGKKPHPDYDLKDWVLSDFKRDDIAKLKDVCAKSCDALELIMSDDIDKAMNKYN